MKYIISLLLLTIFCWQPVVAQSDIELTDSTSTGWGDNIGGGFLPALPTGPVTSLTLSMTDIILDGGDHFRLTAQTNSTAANKAVTWSVDDEGIATVSNNGTVTGLKTGSTIVTATSVSNPEISASCKVTVISDYVAPSSGWILPWGKEEAWTMKYKFFEQANYVEPSNDIFGRSWKELNYDDTSWETLTGPMGSKGDYNYHWEGENNCFCLRRTFFIPVVGNGLYKLYANHDDGIEVYMNGRLVAEYNDWTQDQDVIYIIPNEALTAGDNQLAIYIKQGGGGAYLDYGLYYEDDGEKNVAEIIVHTNEGGIVNGAGIYDKGTEVTLTAIPNNGYRFVKWSDGSSVNPYVIELRYNIELTAYFEPIEGGDDLGGGKIVAIPAGEYNVFYTDNNGKRWYLHAADYNNWAVSETPQTIKFTDGNVTDEQAFADAASFMESNGFYMSNVAGFDGTGPINTVAVDDGLGLEKRIWESQVFYKNDEGKHAIRLTNTTGTDWGCHMFVNINPVTFEVFAGQPTLGDALYLWEIEKSEMVYNVYYYIGKELVHTAEVIPGEKIPEYVFTPTKEGHTFSGWSEVPETMPQHDVTVTGRFVANSYEITYILDGEVFKTAYITYGTTLTPPEVPAKEGYIFAGWTDLPVTMPARDITVTGSYTVGTYMLIYTVDGTVYKTSELEYGASIIAEAAPVKEGHTFSGWSEIPTTMPAKDVTVTGTFTANSYKVTYILDGETFKTETVTYGTAIPTPEVPAKEGYNFSGWGDVPAMMPAKDLTFTGSYTINKDNKFNVIYLVDGTEYKRVVVSFGDPIELLAAPVKDGHTFSGWSEVPETMPLHDVTVTGRFVANSYEITYMLDGEVFKTTYITYGTTVTPPEVPAKEGYIFAGWTDLPVTMPAKNVTVTGSYTINKYTLTYTVDGTVYKTSELEYGANIIAEAAPVKEGHTFSGWSEIPTTMPAKDVTVTGTFTANSYKVTYILDGETFKTETVTYGTAISTPEVPAKEGYNFSGWGDVPATMPAKDLTFTGSYTINKDNKFNVIYMVDGTEYKRVVVSFGDPIELLAAPVKEGHTFSGWSEVPETMPLHDVTVTGTFTVNFYTITYKVDGEVYATEDVAYGEVIVLKDAPVKEGYIFSGWGEVPETMPAMDIEVTGYFEADGIEAVLADRLVDVYTLQGVMIKRQISIEKLKDGLEKGLYIVNGKKMVIR